MFTPVQDAAPGAACDPLADVALDKAAQAASPSAQPLPSPQVGDVCSGGHMQECVRRLRRWPEERVLLLRSTRAQMHWFCHREVRSVSGRRLVMSATVSTRGAMVVHIFDGAHKFQLHLPRPLLRTAFTQLGKPGGGTAQHTSRLPMFAPFLPSCFVRVISAVTSLLREAHTRAVESVP